MPYVSHAIDFAGSFLRYSTMQAAPNGEGVVGAQTRALSLILFGDDQPFLAEVAKHAVAKKGNSFHTVHVPQLTSRGDDLCFAAELCDSVIITAQHSTFAWWMAWLAWMREGRDGSGRDGHIFYNADLHRWDRQAIHTRDNFHPTWIPLLHSEVATADKCERTEIPVGDD